jgi:cobalamin-dependent methionine synthase I
MPGNSINCRGLRGGRSNVSFGMPCRKLINEVFINLAVEAGVDSGIVDPVASSLDRVFLADKQSRHTSLRSTCC